MLRYLGDDTLAGANQMSLLIASGVAACIAFYNRKHWNDILKGILHTLTGAIPAILILLMIGVLAGTWMLSGIIPGDDPLRTVHPAPRLFSAGGGRDFGRHLGSDRQFVVHGGHGRRRTAGYRANTRFQRCDDCRGHHLGRLLGRCRFQPLSDTTNLAAATAEVSLFTHIRYMMFTTGPTMLITLVIFVILSLCSDIAPTGASVESVQQTITTHYNISPLLFIVPVAIVIVMIVRKMPPVPVLFIGGILGGILALICQPSVTAQLSGDAETDGRREAYRVITKAMYGTISMNTGDPAVDALFTSKGMAGMLNTVWLIVTAMIFGGVMEAGHFLERLTSALIRRVHSTGGLVTTTAATCVLFNTTASDQYIAIVIPGKMFAKAYRRNGLAPEVLSRTLEDAGTATSVLIPWNTCGATQSSVLGVATLTYLPYAFFCYLSPLMSILFAWCNIKIRRLVQTDPGTEAENRNN